MLWVWRILITGGGSNMLCSFRFLSPHAAVRLYVGAALPYITDDVHASIAYRIDFSTRLTTRAERLHNYYFYSGACAFS